ncbi:hypothetical protein IIB49_02760, partial [Patescibacteria group bacterium]|nr:hypothetical protein [Patescibacteria group bacterium]
MGGSHAKNSLMSARLDVSSFRESGWYREVEASSLFRNIFYEAKTRLFILVSICCSLDKKKEGLSKGEGMSRKNCLVKISGDVLNDKVFDWIKRLTDEYFVVLCVGGGTQINEAFKKAGFSIEKFGPL